MMEQKNTRNLQHDLIIFVGVGQHDGGKNVMLLDPFALCVVVSN